MNRDGLAPSALISSATFRALSSMMSATATEAPCLASSFARPLPMPLPPPVTTAALPLISVTVRPSGILSESLHDEGPNPAPFLRCTAAA